MNIRIPSAGQALARADEIRIVLLWSLEIPSGVVTTPVNVATSEKMWGIATWGSTCRVVCAGVFVRTRRCSKHGKDGHSVRHGEHTESDVSGSTACTVPYILSKDGTSADDEADGVDLKAIAAALGIREQDHSAFDAAVELAAADHTLAQARAGPSNREAKVRACAMRACP